MREDRITETQDRSAPRAANGSADRRRLPNVRVIATGGTIAAVGKEGQAAVAPRLTGEEVLDRIPAISDVARLEVHDFATVSSYALVLEDVIQLARLVATAQADGCDGVVIMHGTDTIEETAYGLALMVERGIPVTVTGAMTPAQSPYSDGPRNLTAAVRVAATSAAAGLGPMVVSNDLIHAARWAMKLHTSNVASFGSPQAGPLGEIVEENAYIWFHPVYEDYVGQPVREVPRVELVRLFFGCDDVGFRAAAASRPGAIVVEGTGGGHVPPQLLPAVDDALSAGIPVILASRCLAGRVFERTYHQAGAEMDLIRRGVLPAGILSGAKARLRLAIGLAVGRRPGELFPV